MVDSLSAQAAFEAAVVKAGSISALARIAKCTPGNISQLRQKGSPLSAQYVLAVEAATGISRHDLRPDIYPLESGAAPHDLEPAR